MKSQNQTASSEWDVWAAAFSADSKIPASILIDGIKDRETALRAHRKAHEYDASAEQKAKIADELAKYE